MAGTRRRTAALLIAGALIVAGCADPDGQSPDSEPEPAAADEPEPEPEPAAVDEPEPEPEPQTTELLTVEATALDVSNFGNAGDRLTLTFSSGVSEESLPVVRFDAETSAVCAYTVECEFDDNVVTMTWFDSAVRGPRDFSNASVTEVKDTTDVNGLDIEVPEPVSITQSEPERPTNVRYESVYDLRERVEEAGFMCEDWAVIGNPAGAIERATCNSALVLSIHENAAQVERSVENIAELSGAIDEPSNHVVGPNWSVNCGSEADVCIALRETLGGEVDSREL